MYNVQDYSVLYNNTVRSVICEGWQFTHMCKRLAGTHHLTSLTLPLFITMPILGKVSDYVFVY